MPSSSRLSLQVTLIIFAVSAILAGGSGYYLGQNQAVTDSVTTPSDSSSPGKANLNRTAKSFIDRNKLPGFRNSSVHLNLPEQEVQLFSASFGSAQDCPAGCFYSRATGIVNGKKVGWIKVEDYDGNDFFTVSKKMYYDFDETDSYLMSEAFWISLGSPDMPFHKSDFMELLIRDADTPEAVLLRIVQNEMRDYLIRELLANERVRKSKVILTELASLPRIAYANVSKYIDEAQTLLDRLQ